MINFIVNHSRAFGISGVAADVFVLPVFCPVFPQGDD
jgi:hypothetical protein